MLLSFFIGRRVGSTTFISLPSVVLHMRGHFRAVPIGSSWNEGLLTPRELASGLNVRVDAGRRVWEIQNEDVERPSDDMRPSKEGVVCFTADTDHANYAAISKPGNRKEHTQACRSWLHF